MTPEGAIKQLKEYILGMNYMDDEAVWMAIKALEQQPKVGKWIKTSLSQISGGDFNRGFKCSCCGYVTVVDDFNYCPNCGARMGVDDNDIR